MWNLKEILGLDEDFRIQFIPAKNRVAADLIKMVRAGNYGTVIMGKRGLSGIKRRLLGSVSASLLRGLSKQTFFWSINNSKWGVVFRPYIALFVPKMSNIGNSRFS